MAMGTYGGQYGGTPWDWVFRSGMMPSAWGGGVPGGGTVTPQGYPPTQPPTEPPTYPPIEPPTYPPTDPYQPPLRPPDQPPGYPPIGPPEPPIVGPYNRPGDPFSNWPGQPPVVGAPQQPRSPGQGMVPMNKLVDAAYGAQGKAFGSQGGPWKQFVRGFGSGSIV